MQYGTSNVYSPYIPVILTGYTIPISNQFPATATCGLQLLTNASIYKGLMWNFDCHHKVELYKFKSERFQAFCELLVALETSFNCEPYAQKLKELPETQRGAKPELTKKLSFEAALFIDSLDELFQTYPLVAIKIAAITAAISEYLFVSKAANQKLCEYLIDENVPIQSRLELGFIIRKHWPDLNHYIRAFDETMLDLVVPASKEHPEFISNLIQRYQLYESSSFTYIFSVSDDKSQLLKIANHLIQVFPRFTKQIYRIYLSAGRLKYCGFNATESELQSVADALFRLEDASPYTDAKSSGFVYFSLCSDGNPDSDWYQIVLERLYTFALKEQAVDWMRVIALNTPQSSPLHSQACAFITHYILRFQCIDYQHLSEENRRKLNGVFTFLLESMRIYTDKHNFCHRNLLIPLQPDHALVTIARCGCMNLLDWLVKMRSDALLPILVMVIERAEDPLVTKAVKQFELSFEEIANLNPNEAASALASLAKYINFDSDNPKKVICFGLFQKFIPVLESISDEAAQKARLGLRHPLDR